ncbi:hypothetical protein [Niabella ginsengisoli]|uniref:Riboflavin synthase n=1 Tax=Niabella ginsengisoli TaxID=522298 RepID=A0ABS9SFA3_9BACT|nr:hypothetical protein [Niabella ginsengisoli]MCH5597042.1 hypothetical protein [Niabella ginsengisoli]
MFFINKYFGKNVIDPEISIMFTGIIEATGIIKRIASSGSNKTFWIESDISNELKVDQSVSHNGVCLTVETISGNVHSVTAINETLKKQILDR